jgi:hypothetical protein
VPAKVQPPQPSARSLEDLPPSIEDVPALRLLSRRITAALVVVAVVGMTFTAATVTLFAIDHGVDRRIAWTLDPMVAIALLVVLVADARLVELGVSPGGWPRVLRWFAGMATWAMNAWQSVWPDGGFGVPRQIDPAGVVLHSVSPVLLIVLAEAATGYRRVIADRIRVLEGLPVACPAPVVVADALDTPELVVRAATPDHPNDQPGDHVTAVPVVAPAAAEPVENAAVPVERDDCAGGQLPRSDAELRRAARRLHRETVRATRRPVTVDMLRTGLGVSRRRAVELRREVLRVPAGG